MKVLGKVLLAVAGLSVSGCANRSSFTYPLASLKLNQIGLSCSESQALSIAHDAVVERYPHLGRKLRANPFSVFASSHRGNAEDVQHVFSLQAIFDYRRVGEPELGTHFEEAVTVELTRECAVVGASYFKGKVQITP